MSETSTEIRTVVVERDLPFAPDKVWRALTQPHLLAEWLMKTDFAPTLGHSFKFSGDWGSVDGKVLQLEPNRTLAYSWDAMGLESTVTWTLTPSATGTHLRMEQVGFRPEQEQAYQGARFGWARMLTTLETVLAGQD